MLEFALIEQALKDLKSGKIIILINENKEHEGKLVLAAEHATPEAINFMSRHGCGLICLSMTGEQIDKLAIPMMEESASRCACTVSIEAAKNVSTGSSAKDRAKTIQVAINAKSGPADIVSPGHIFPLRAKPRGLLERLGHTEGSIDLVRLAKMTPAAVICDLLNDDGDICSLLELSSFSKKYSIPLITMKDLIEYRVRHEVLVCPEASTRLPLYNKGDFEMILFANSFDKAEHLALVKQPIANKPPLVRIHSECITGDLFGSVKCDCGNQLDTSLSLLAEEGGILIYLRQEGRGIGLANKLKAYQLQEQGFDTLEANSQLGLPIDNRSYAVAYQILKYLGIESIRLLTNNPAKINAIESFGIKVTERVPLEVEPNKENYRYLKTKKDKMGHLLENSSLLKKKKNN